MEREVIYGSRVRVNSLEEEFELRIRVKRRVKGRVRFKGRVRVMADLGLLMRGQAGLYQGL